MFSPIKWLRPRLKQFCIVFGAIDMTLILLSIIGWHFFFHVTFEAQHDRQLLDYQKLLRNRTPNTPSTPNAVISQRQRLVLYKIKEERTREELRLERTKRACKLDSLDIFFIDEEFSTPASLIGVSMGSYFILGALLTSAIVVEWHAGLKVLCLVCIYGEAICTVFLLLAVVILFADEGFCPTEYYFEDFQPILVLLVLTLIFIFCYKIYEITVITLYLADEVKKVGKEKRETEERKRSTDKPATMHHYNTLKAAYEAALSAPAKENEAVQVGSGTVRASDVVPGKIKTAPAQDFVGVSGKVETAPAQSPGNVPGRRNKDRVRDMTRRNQPEIHSKGRESSERSKGQYETLSESSGRSDNRRRKRSKKTEAVGPRRPDVVSKAAQSTRRQQDVEIESQTDAQSRPSSRSLPVGKPGRKQKSKKIGTGRSHRQAKETQSRISQPESEDCEVTRSEPILCESTVDQEEPSDSCSHFQPKPLQLPPGICPCHVLRCGISPPPSPECTCETDDCKNDPPSAQNTQYTLRLNVQCNDSAVNIKRKDQSKKDGETTDKSV